MSINLHSTSLRLRHFIISAFPESRRHSRRALAHSFFYDAVTNRTRYRAYFGFSQHKSARGTVKSAHRKIGQSVFRTSANSVKTRPSHQAIIHPSSIHKENPMETDCIITPVGTVRNARGEFALEIAADFIPALANLHEFSHINILWWANHVDTAEARAARTVERPYRGAPDTLGIFATRSPMRPNPVALSTCGITGIDMKKGIVRLGYIDADNHTPVIDIKPYLPCTDRVRTVKTGLWYAKWPSCLEDSAEFDWTTVFGVVE
jgi:tRNA-Thr(GGU) m(6)t(6)A37 methyltransferase TsaA